MAKILICWIGNTDLRAPLEEDTVGIGPIAQAVRAQLYDEIALINNFPGSRVPTYLNWLQKRTPATVTISLEKLSGPTNFGEIYQAATKIVSNKIKKYGSETKLTFHLSPGTPAMAAVCFEHCLFRSVGLAYNINGYATFMIGSKGGPKAGVR